MRYLILAAGVGKRMGSALAGLPKCMIDIDGEPLLAGCCARSGSSTPRPTSTSCWATARDHRAAARGLPDHPQPVLRHHRDQRLAVVRARVLRPAADVVARRRRAVGRAVAGAVHRARTHRWSPTTATVLDPREINIRADAWHRVTRFGVNFSGLSGAYAGVLKLSAHAAAAVRPNAGRADPARVQRTAHLLFLRHAPADRGSCRGAGAVRFRRASAGRKSTTPGTSPRHGSASAPGCRPMPDGAHAPTPCRKRTASCASASFSTPAGIRWTSADTRRRSGWSCRATPVELGRDHNAICYRVRLCAADGRPLAAVVKVPRMGPQRTNADTSFSWEARILASLPAAGITAGPGLLGPRRCRRDALPVHGRGSGPTSGSSHPSAGRAEAARDPRPAVARWTRAA